MRRIFFALLVGAALMSGGFFLVGGDIGLNQAQAGCLDQRQC